MQTERAPACSVAAHSAPVQTPLAPGEAAVRDDTISALMALGYPKAIAERAVSFALREEGERTIEAVLKRALRRLFAIPRGGDGFND